MTVASPDAPRLGDRLRKSRTDRDLSLREVERRSGINSGYLSQLERNEIANPTPSVLQKVAKAYEEPFPVLMQWAGYFENDPQGVSPNAKRALSVIGDDFTDEELQALKAVLDVMRGRNRATFTPPHRTDLALADDERTDLRKHALAVLREIDALATSERVDMDDVLVVAKLIKAGAIELTPDEKKRLRSRFRGLVDLALSALQGVVHLDRGEVYLNPDLNRWEQRKRFVIGHEAAHAILEDHRLAFAHLDDRSRLNHDFADRLERQANQFSIEVLAKGDRLRKEFDDSPPSIAELKRLKQDYGISWQAAARRLAEESNHPCAIALAYRTRHGEGDLFVNGYKLWCSKSFEDRLGWRSRGAPNADIRTALGMTAAGGVLPPLVHSDTDGQPVPVAVQGKDAHYAVFVLFSCPPRPRLNLRRANPLSRIRSA
jgi:transcriptional regulator with XRE-family HTH domain